MSIAQNIKITMTSPNRGEVHVDGQKLTGVRGFTFSSGVDGTPSLTVQIIARTVEVDAVGVDVHQQVVDVTTLDNTGSRVHSVVADGRPYMNGQPKE